MDTLELGGTDMLLVGTGTSTGEEKTCLTAAFAFFAGFSARFRSWIAGTAGKDLLAAFLASLIARCSRDLDLRDGMVR